MNKALSCSACHASIPEGAKFCHGCALPLTAFAVAQPTPRKRKRQSHAALLGWTAIAIAIIVAIAIGNQRNAAAAAAQEQALATFKADLYDNGTLATPEAFQARCGQAQQVLHDTSGRTKGDTVLSYQGGTFHVRFHPGDKPALRIVHVDIDRRGHVSTWEGLTDESIVYDRLGCSAR
jgi:hypothetical protein